MADQNLIRIEAGNLKTFVTDIFVAKAMLPADAGIVADVLVWAQLRGIDSHGVIRVPRYLGFIDQGNLDAKAVPEIIRDMPAAFVMAAHKAAGPVAMTSAMEHAIVSARTNGVAMGVVGQTTHTGPIGYYALRAAEAGLIGLVLASGPPNMAYFGARVPSLHTAPVAIAVPAHEGRPLLLDMASAVVSLGKVRHALDAGRAIPEGWALTKDGRPTTDPAEAAIQLPLGGPKGSGLSLMIECLTGMLAGVPILTAMLPPEGKRSHVQNGLVMAIDIEAFMDGDAYRREVDRLVQTLKALPRADGVDDILMPGERGARMALDRCRDGIPVVAKTWDRVTKLAQELGVAPPQL
ncbi:MAG: Ldh family oxidoreductase [Alphaproteobacteria bacterium]